MWLEFRPWPVVSQHDFYPARLNRYNFRQSAIHAGPTPGRRLAANDPARAGPSAETLGGLADHQFRFEDHLAMAVSLIARGLVEQQAGGGAAELLPGLANRRQRHRRRGREVDVVVADDRDVVRHRDVVAGH